MKSNRNPSKERTLHQVETAQGRAVRFAENVLGDDDLAEELENLTVEEYADRKRIHLVTPNPRKENNMAKTRQQLIEENEQLANENEKLNMKLDAILDLAALPTDEDDDDSDDDDSDDDDSDDDDMAA